MKIDKWFTSRVLAAAILVAGLIMPLRAATTDDVDIHVSISASKSLSVNTTFFDFGALDVRISSVSNGAIIVTNDSTALIETYTLMATDAISDSGGTDWTLASSTGPDQVVLEAQFSDARPSDSNPNWSQDSVSNGTTTCTDNIFGNGTASESGQEVMPAATRNLWFRIRTPSSVTNGGPHTMTVTISVL